MINKVKEIIARHTKFDVSEISDNSAILGELCTDSLDLIEILNDFETEYNIEISDDEAYSVKTVKDAALMLEQKIK